MELEHDPFSGVFYVFHNHAFNKLKISFWENNRFIFVLQEPCKGETPLAGREQH